MWKDILWNKVVATENSEDMKPFIFSLKEQLYIVRIWNKVLFESIQNIFFLQNLIFFLTAGFISLFCFEPVFKYDNNEQICAYIWKHHERAGPETKSLTRGCFES